MGAKAGISELGQGFPISAKAGSPPYCFRSFLMSQVQIKFPIESVKAIEDIARKIKNREGVRPKAAAQKCLAERLGFDNWHHLTATLENGLVIDQVDGRIVVERKKAPEPSSSYLQTRTQMKAAHALVFAVREICIFWGAWFHEVERIAPGILSHTREIKPESFNDIILKSDYNKCEDIVIAALSQEFARGAGLTRLYRCEKDVFLGAVYGKTPSYWDENFPKPSGSPVMKAFMERHPTIKDRAIEIIENGLPIRDEFWVFEEQRKRRDVTLDERVTARKKEEKTFGDFKAIASDSKKMILYCKESYKKLCRPEPVDAHPGEHRNNAPMNGYDAEVYLNIADKISVTEEIIQVLREASIGKQEKLNNLVERFEKAGRTDRAIKYCIESHKVLFPEYECLIYRGMYEKLKAADELVYVLSVVVINQERYLQEAVRAYESAAVDPYYARSVLFTKANNESKSCSTIHEYKSIKENSDNLSN